MTVTIRLMSDRSLYPFYVDEGNGRFELTEPEDPQQLFRLPDEVMHALLDWSDLGGSGWASWEDEKRYINRGRAAARLLRQHLPAHVRIEYTGADNISAEYY